MKLRSLGLSELDMSSCIQGYGSSAGQMIQYPAVAASRTMSPVSSPMRPCARVSVPGPATRAARRWRCAG
jgi:hypothetical protein